MHLYPSFGQPMNDCGAFALSLCSCLNWFFPFSQVATIFVQAGMFQQVTAFLIEVLKEDKEEQSELQTRLLEITLSHCSPNITEGIFANDMLSHFDKNRIGKLCEQKQLYARVRTLERIGVQCLVFCRKGGGVSSTFWWCCGIFL